VVETAGLRNSGPQTGNLARKARGRRAVAASSAGPGRAAIRARAKPGRAVARVSVRPASRAGVPMARALPAARRMPATAAPVRQRPQQARPDFETTQPLSNANAIGLRPQGKGPRPWRRVCRSARMFRDRGKEQDSLAGKGQARPRPRPDRSRADFDDAAAA
jgi:hypothetical protein